jgi:signal transduction histidine kinase
MVMRDLTELREAQFELERYQEGLEDLVRERSRQLEDTQAELVKTEGLAVLGRLTATVSHEIRNPLSTIRNGVFSMVNAAEKGETERLIRSRSLVERNIERCDRILSELLKYAERSAPVLERMPLDPWIESCLARMGIPPGIQVDLRKGCPEQVAIDRGQLYTALENMIRNSVDAILEVSDEEGTISINTYVDSGKAWIRITDTGAGIPDDHIIQVFDPLFSTKTYGVGLGLPVARSIIEAHGGDVRIAQSVDGGTEIRISLPLAKNS